MSTSSDDPVIGRPTLYRPEYAEQVRKLARLGATDMEIADFFGVNVATIYRWANEHEDFCEARKNGKEAADERVERALYHRALGYSHDAVKIMVADKTVVREEYVEHYPPDTTAAIFWLKNRRPEAWRDKQEIDHRSGDGSMSPKDHSAAVLEALRAKHDAR